MDNRATELGSRISPSHLEMLAKSTDKPEILLQKLKLVDAFWTSEIGRAHD
mgnify:CR=1 FL=1